MTYTIITPDFDVGSKRRISAAASIPKHLYQAALQAAQAHDEGNFSRYVRRLIRNDLQDGTPRGETRFPGISRHAKALQTNRTHLFLVLTGKRPSRSLLQRYTALLKKEGRPVPQLPAAA